jgi:hypothetical protein
MEEATLVISARFGAMAGTSEMAVRQMHLKQYRVVRLACISFAAILWMLLIEPTLEKVASALK